MMRFLVTGGCGFIGSHFVEILHSTLGPSDEILVLDKLTYAGNLRNLESLTEYDNVKIFQVDICDKLQVNEHTSGIDVVIHFAAESHVDRSIEDGSDFIATNVAGTYNLLEAAYASKVGQFLHVSTDEVYGSLPTGSATELAPLLPNSPYAASKAASDLVALSFWKTHGLNVMVTRCSNNYGPRQFPEKVIPVFVRKILAGEPVPMYGSGLNIREWIHVSDHCRALLKILEKGSAGEIYNIGSGIHLSNLDLFKTLNKLSMQTDSDINFVADRKGHDFRYSVDSTKIQSLGHRNTVDILEGLTETYQWYSNNENWWG